MKRYHLLLLISLALIDPIYGALTPATSEKLKGQPVQGFDTETSTGEPFSFSSVRGKSVVVNFFTSWCPVCMEERAQLQQLQPILNKRGIMVLGVLVDPIVTSYSTAKAVEELKHNPLPFQVLLMNPSMQTVFHYEGFPATYFITAGGKFSTTLLGYHSGDQILSMVNSVFPESPLDSTTVLLAQQAAMAKSSDWGKKPFLAFLPRHWKQWHPTLIHFPIALLVLEAGFLLAFRIRPSQQIATFSQWLLYLTCISLPLVIYSGISDVGANMGPGWAFWNGLKDRITNFLRMESTVSLHVLLALCLTFLLVTRVIWRIRSGQQVLWGKQGYAFLAASLLGLWLLFAIGQVGGSISHP